MLQSKNIWQLNEEKQRPIYIQPQENHFRDKDTQRIKVKNEKRYSMQMERKKAGISILILDKIDLKQSITHDK